MATKSPLRLAALSLRRPPPPPPPTTTTKRTFLSSLLAAATSADNNNNNNNGNEKPLHIHVSRHLPYPRAQLYGLIADVDSYARFLPYCKHSRVTAWGAAADNEEATTTTTTTKKWPTAGELALGWGPLDHTYTSRIVCVPGHSVEAHSGQDEPLCRHEDQRRGYRNPFRKLSTRWALRDAATAAAANTNTTNNTRTTVDLDINMTLHDAMTQAVLSQMVDGVAAEMIEAFEKRAEQMFGPK